MPAITFPTPARAPYLGGCVTEPAFFALNYFVNWTADVTVGETVYRDVPVLDFLKGALKDPASVGVSAQEAQAARAHFIESAGQAIEQEGGQRAWLEKEFA